jgi:5-methylthioadenosine/S-adenosylhomocysteine deaminase
MTGKSFSRRGLMQGAAALGTAALIPQGLSAQQVGRTASAPGAPLPGRGELLIRGITVLTMDPAVPDLAAGDVHVREGAIVAVASMIEAPAAQVIDGAGMICIPGFVDTHFHLWNGLFRLFVRADVPALGYFPVTARLGPLMEPEDSYRSVRLGAAEALAAGVTTVHNWSHNTRSPEHGDAELSGMRDMGIRGRFAYGTPVGMADDVPMDIAGLARVKKEWMPDKDNLLTLGICSRNLGALTIGGSAAATSRGVLTIEQIKRDWDGARALGLPITMHTSGASPIMELERAGLLGSDVQLVHPLLTTEHRLESRRWSRVGLRRGPLMRNFRSKRPSGGGR